MCVRACVSGVVSTVVWSGPTTEQKHPLVQHVQQLVRSANPGAAFVQAERGAVSRWAPPPSLSVKATMCHVPIAARWSSLCFTVFEFNESANKTVPMLSGELSIIPLFHSFCLWWMPIRPTRVVTVATLHWKHSTWRCVFNKDKVYGVVSHYIITRRTLLELFTDVNSPGSPGGVCQNCQKLHAVTFAAFIAKFSLQTAFFQCLSVCFPDSAEMKTWVWFSLRAASTSRRCWEPVTSSTPDGKTLIPCSALLAIAPLCPPLSKLERQVGLAPPPCTLIASLLQGGGSAADCF